MQFPESVHRDARSAEGHSSVEEEPNALLHLFVGIENRPALAVVDEARGQGAAISPRVAPC